MGRMFGILMIVLGVWIGMEFYTVGFDDAFGGVFAGMADPINAQHDTGYDDSSNEARPTMHDYEARSARHDGSIAQRVKAAVTSDMKSGYERREDGIGSD